MAYPLYEDTQLDSPKSTQIYPEEYEFPSYYHKISEIKVNYPPVHTTKKSKKASPSVSYVNERKCPIYVHQYNASTYNYPKATPKQPPEKFAPKFKKIPGFPTTKSVLDQLEESYWATWKPNKDTTNAVMKKTRVQVHDNQRISKIKAYGDVPDNLTGYLTSSDYETSAVEESDYEKYEALMNMQGVFDNKNNSVRLKITNTQEIQTDNIPPPPLPRIEERAEPVKPKETPPEDKSSDEDPIQESNGEKSKLLKHTDSFIINKKKQSEVKEHFQQPKCIRLYRKPGISTSFIRGGSYPLKSCLKREPTPKGNFRLGPPGSPLFVTNNSFHKKSKK